MDLLQLQYFTNVARMEHMTKAAESLHIAQPALSMMISRLEADLGVALFDRHGRQIRLNAYGRAFLAKVNIALTALEDGKRELKDMSGMDDRQIKLGVTTLDRLANVLNPFIQLYPQTKFRITQAVTEERKFNLLERGELDLCLTSSTALLPNISSMTILTEDIVLAVSPQHRLAGHSSVQLKELAVESFITLQPGNSIRDIMDINCAKAGFTPDYVCEGEEPHSINSLVRSGIGIAFVPEAAQRYEDQLAFVKLEDPNCSWNLQLTWAEKRYLSTAARTFRDYIAEHFKVQYYQT